MQAEFIPTGIVKLHGGLEETCWRYLLTWKRSAVGSAEASFGICTDVRGGMLPCDAHHRRNPGFLPASVLPCHEQKYACSHYSGGGLGDGAADREDWAVPLVSADCKWILGQMQNRIRDAERLEAKGKTTDLRALRISTVHEHWPRLAEAFEAKCMADAARRASKASKSPSAPDRAMAGMRHTLRAFLQRPPTGAAAKPAAGAIHIFCFAIIVNGLTGG